MTYQMKLMVKVVQAVGVSALQSRYNRIMNDDNARHYESEKTAEKRSEPHHVTHLICVQKESLGWV
jgi:hypothetical protein